MIPKLSRFGTFWTEWSSENSRKVSESLLSNRTKQQTKRNLASTNHAAFLSWCQVWTYGMDWRHKATTVYIYIYCILYIYNRPAAQECLQEQRPPPKNALSYPTRTCATRPGSKKLNTLWCSELWLSRASRSAKRATSNDGTCKVTP